MVVLSEVSYIPSMYDIKPCRFKKYSCINNVSIDFYSIITPGYCIRNKCSTQKRVFCFNIYFVLKYGVRHVNCCTYAYSVIFWAVFC